MHHDAAGGAQRRCVELVDRLVGQQIQAAAARGNVALQHQPGAAALGAQAHRAHALGDHAGACGQGDRARGGGAAGGQPEVAVASALHTGEAGHGRRRAAAGAWQADGDAAQANAVQFGQAHAGAALRGQAARGDLQRIAGTAAGGAHAAGAHGATNFLAGLQQQAGCREVGRSAVAAVAIGDGPAAGDQRHAAGLDVGQGDGASRDDAHGTAIAAAQRGDPGVAALAHRAGTTDQFHRPAGMDDGWRVQADGAARQPAGLGRQGFKGRPGHQTDRAASGGDRGHAIGTAQGEQVAACGQQHGATGGEPRSGQFQARLRCQQQVARGHLGLQPHIGGHTAGGRGGAAQAQGVVGRTDAATLGDEVHIRGHQIGTATGCKADDAAGHGLQRDAGRTGTHHQAVQRQEAGLLAQPQIAGHLAGNGAAADQGAHLQAGVGAADTRTTEGAQAEMVGHDLTAAGGVQCEVGRQQHGVSTHLGLHRHATGAAGRVDLDPPGRATGKHGTGDHQRIGVGTGRQAAQHDAAVLAGIARGDAGHRQGAGRQVVQPDHAGGADLQAGRGDGQAGLRLARKVGRGHIAAGLDLQAGRAQRSTVLQRGQVGCLQAGTRRGQATHVACRVDHQGARRDHRLQQHQVAADIERECSARRQRTGHPQRTAHSDGERRHGRGEGAERGVPADRQAGAVCRQVGVIDHGGDRRGRGRSPGLDGGRLAGAALEAACQGIDHAAGDHRHVAHGAAQRQQRAAVGEFDGARRLERQIFGVAQAQCGLAGDLAVGLHGDATGAGLQVAQ